MTDSEDLKRDVKELLGSQNLAVLATEGEGQPHTSLVAFAATEGLDRILFSTERKTRKFANLQANGRVAFLVDSRAMKDIDFKRSVAVTAYGKMMELTDEELKDCLALFLSKHPQLTEFTSSPDCSLVCIAIDRYSVASRFKEVQELLIDQPV